MCILAFCACRSESRSPEPLALPAPELAPPTRPELDPTTAHPTTLRFAEGRAWTLAVEYAARQHTAGKPPLALLASGTATVEGAGSEAPELLELELAVRPDAPALHERVEAAIGRAVDELRGGWTVTAERDNRVLAERKEPNGTAWAVAVDGHPRTVWVQRSHSSAADDGSNALTWRLALRMTGR